MVTAETKKKIRQYILDIGMMISGLLILTITPVPNPRKLKVYFPRLDPW